MKAFRMTAARGASFGFSSSAEELPGAPGGVVRVCNVGPCAVAVLLGEKNSVATQSTGLVIPPNTVEWLDRNGQDYIAGCALGGYGNSAMVNIAVGSLA